MISLSPMTFDPAGSLWLSELPTSELYTQTRRVSRRQLLDGSVSIYDGGISDGDRTLNIQARATQQTLNRAAELQRLYNRLIISAPDGVYIGLIENLAYDAPILSLSIMLEKRL